MTLILRHVQVHVKPAWFPSWIVSTFESTLLTHTTSARASLLKPFLRRCSTHVRPGKSICFARPLADGRPFQFSFSLFARSNPTPSSSSSSPFWIHSSPNCYFDHNNVCLTCGDTLSMSMIRPGILSDSQSHHFILKPFHRLLTDLTGSHTFFHLTALAICRFHAECIPLWFSTSQQCLVFSRIQLLAISCSTSHFLISKKTVTDVDILFPLAFVCHLRSYVFSFVDQLQKRCASQTIDGITLASTTSTKLVAFTFTFLQRAIHELENESTNLACSFARVVQFRFLSFVFKLVLQLHTLLVVA